MMSGPQRPVRYSLAQSMFTEEDPWDRYLRKGVTGGRKWAEGQLELDAGSARSRRVLKVSQVEPR